MQILVLPGTHDCANFGDLAMLQVALERLRQLWPDASLHVLTHQPAALLQACPGVIPVPLRGRNRWLRVRTLPRWLAPTVPPHIRQRFPATPAQWLKSGLFLLPGQHHLVRAFANGLFKADLFVMAGCGVLTDAFGYNALRILDTFAAAIRAGIPSALLSQGIGPIVDPALARRAKEVLPHLQAIFIRERLSTLPLLHQCGVPAHRIHLTGDDAVALAGRERRDEPGTHLGVNLRVARYAEHDAQVITNLRPALLDHAQRHAATLCGIPILSRGEDSDVATLDALFSGLPAHLVNAGHDLPTPQAVARRIAQCRVVVTGSYHGGVFALAQGIPAICLAQSSYYREKFEGLADQFGEGCQVLPTGDPSWPERLRASLDHLWRQAPTLRPSLLQAAARQIKAAEAAYATLPTLVSDPEATAAPAA